MITFGETLNQQPAPSAQLKPVAKAPAPRAPVQKQNILQSAISTAKNFIGGIVGNPVKTAQYVTNPIGAIAQNSLKKPVENIYKNVVKPGSTVDTVVKGKFSEIPRAFAGDIKYANDNFKRDAVIADKAMKGGYDSLSPEEKDFSKQRTIGLLGTVDAGAGLFPNAAKKNVEKVVEKVVEKKPQTLVERVVASIREAAPVRAEQQQLYKEELRSRAGKVVEAGKTLKGEAAHKAQLEALKGELPQATYTPIKNKFTSKEVGTLKDMIETNKVLSPLEKVTTKSAIDKVMSGVVPQRAELAKLRTVFGEEFASAAENLSLGKKIIRTAFDVVNIPKSVMATGDLSAGLRQAVFAGPKNPGKFASAFKNQFKYFASQNSYDDLMTRITNDVDYPLSRDSGLSLSDITGNLDSREEAFRSTLAEKIPYVKELIKASNRGFSGFLNQFRYDMWKDFTAAGKALGKAEDEKYFKDVASFVNASTGRGELPKLLQGSTDLLNAGFFSPRLIFSRLQLLNPKYYYDLEPAVRKEAVKTLLTFVGTGLSIITAADLAGADVVKDWRSSDFGKIKVGNTRFDIWGGFQQYVRLLGQSITGESINSRTGKVYKFGEGYKPTTRSDIAFRFLEGKLNPAVGLGLDIYRGRDIMGDPVDPKSAMVENFVPLSWQEIKPLVEENGPLKGVLMSIPGFFGTGVQTYDSKPKKSSKSRIGSGALLR